MRIFLLFISFCIAATASGQNITVTPIGPSSDNPLHTYTLNEATLSVQGETLSLTGIAEAGAPAPLTLDLVRTFDVSLHGNFLGALQLNRELRGLLFDGNGERILDFELRHFDPMDETLKVQVMRDGKLITRDNVANFNFYDPLGRLQYSVSNSSGSEEGEAVSEIVSDTYGSAVLLTNPQINYADGQGSRARLVRGENEISTLFQSRQRTLKYAGLTRNGSFVVLISENSGSDDEVLVTDRFGNQLFTVASSDDLKGASLSEDAQIITIYSGNRAQVYRISDGELLGSTSFRSTILYAVYNSIDEQILALSGNVGQSNQITDPEIHAVHLGVRRIARTEIPYPLSFLDHGRLSFDRDEANQFDLTGLNRTLRIRTEF